jgi:hypothetical protein
MAEIMIELSETELDAVAGGAGSASFTVTNTASGTTATVSSSVTQRTTASSASQSGRFGHSRHPVQQRLHGSQPRQHSGMLEWRQRELHPHRQQRNVLHARR